MINPATSKFLSLDSYTQSACEQLYEELNEKYNDSAELMNKIENGIDNPKLLGKIWWVMNYYSEQFDRDRKIRGFIERKLDQIASEKSKGEPENN